MNQYLELVKLIKETGTVKSDRTGTGTKSIFGHQMRFDLAEGFPLVTTKFTPIKAIIHELLWIIKGDTNIAYLNNNGVKIWNEWATEDGELGPVYGEMWRSWPTGKDDKVIDQLTNVIKEIQINPDSRRLIISAWNPSLLPNAVFSPSENAGLGLQALPPCHTLFQFYVLDGKLSCQLYQRSADVFLGVPFNIASYALLTMMIAQVCGLEYGEFIHTLGDAHLYSNHEKQVEELLTRVPLALPTMYIDPLVTGIGEFTIDSFSLRNYNRNEAIKAPVSV